MPTSPHVHPIFRSAEVKAEYRAIRERYASGHISRFSSTGAYLHDLAAEARELNALLGAQYWNLPGFVFFHRVAMREPERRRSCALRGGPLLGRASA